jgi:hypothetical protein
MIYSYTQIANYLRCPRSNRYRYLDGWREKDTRAAMIFGRCFEKALEGYFCGEDCGVALYREWGTYRDTAFECKKGETWDHVLQRSTRGFNFSSASSRAIECTSLTPKRIFRSKWYGGCLMGTNFFPTSTPPGELDALRCLMDWKTTTSRYPEEPTGLLALDPQLICYSWATGISEVALVVFVRKHHSEIQCLRASISAAQRSEFGRLVETTIGQIEAAQFPSHSGIRFPQNGCVSCSHLSLCLGNQGLVDGHLIRTARGKDLA